MCRLWTVWRPVQALVVSLDLSRSYPQLTGEDPAQVHIILVEPCVRLSQLLDLATGMQNRGVIPAAKALPDFGQAVVGQFLGECHGHLSRPCDRAGTFFAKQIGQTNLEIFGDGLLDVLRTERGLTPGDCASNV